MNLKPITRQEQIIAGKDLEPITRTEKFLKQYGGASSWNDLNDKPFGSETRMIFSWDGNTDGLEMIDGGDGCYYYKITDEVFMIEEFAGATVSLPSYGVEVPAEEAVSEFNGFPILADGLAVIATNTDSIFPSTGIWSSVPISVYVEKISTIPKKYLPSLNHKEVTNAVVPQLTMRQGKTRKVVVDSAIAQDGEFVHRFAYLIVSSDNIPHTYLLATSSAFGINEQNGTFVLEYDTAIDLSTGVTLTKLRFTFDGQTDDAVLKSITCSYPKSIMLMSNGGKKFNVAVGDNGTLIATEI